MAFSFIELPKYQPSPLLDLSPINNALSFASRENQYAQKNAREDQQLSMQQEKLGMEKKQFDEDMRSRLIKEMGARATSILEIKDPVQQRAAYDLAFAKNPKFAAAAQENGIDLNDHIGTLKIVQRDALGVKDPQAQRLTEAQINNLNRREEPDIVRTLRAAGIDPRSDKGRELIANSIKGNDPVGQVISEAIKSANQPPAAPQSPIRPQSYNGPDGTSSLMPIADMQPSGQPSGDPNLIPVQGPAQQPQQNDGLVDTPLGRLAPARAKLLGFGLAYQGKGEAGKMMMPPDDKLGKEGVNHAEKMLVDKAMDVNELTQMRDKFKGEFLGLEGQAKAVGLSWGDWLSSGNLAPDKKKWLSDYTSFATATTERLNNRIKTLSGSAVSGAEEKRMYAANPSMNDGPTVYASKLQQQIDMQLMAVARYNYLRTQFKGTPEQIAELAKSGKIESLPLDGMKKIYDDRSSQITQQLKNQYPQARPEQLDAARRQTLKQEFGI